MILPRTKGIGVARDGDDRVAAGHPEAQGAVRVTGVFGPQPGVEGEGVTGVELRIQQGGQSGRRAPATTG